MIVLYEYIFTINFTRVFNEKFDLENWLGYGLGTSSLQIL